MEEIQMNDYDTFKATLEIMEFHLNEDIYETSTINEWVDALTQILQMYYDMANIDSGESIHKTENKNDTYYGEKGIPSDEQLSHDIDVQDIKIMRGKKDD